MFNNQERLRSESEYITYQDYELLLDYDENDIDDNVYSYGLYEDLENIMLGDE